MAELGPIAAEEHERIGDLAARLGVDRLVVVGDEARAIAVAAVREGIEPDHVSAVADVDAAIADVRAAAEPGDVVLCKASRVVGLERVAEALR
jgi:UDP-N-acetylmuramoyl-tripeptide--D-alanyl-D-alanine ligase